MEVTKNGKVEFLVSGDYSKWWFFEAGGSLDIWEPETFHILNYYKNFKSSIYLDIGAWIGPTVMYSANIYNNVIAVEPDPIALERLKENLNVNNFNNINLIEKALSDKNGITQFGGNGDLGNSESTILVDDSNFFSYSGRHTKYWKGQQNNIIQVETITIEKLIEEQNINPENLSLIKIDIEGGEKIVIPYLKSFLTRYKPVLYISLHCCYLKPEEFIMIIDILFEIYDKCYVFNSNGNKKLVNKSMVKNQRLQSLVFE